MTGIPHKPIRDISWTWDEGRYWDLWMFVHLISGTILGIVIGLFEFTFFVGLSIAVLLMVAWELFEDATGVHEVPENRFLDVVVGALGYLAIPFFLPSDRTDTFVILIMLGVILSILEFLGWRAYQERTGRDVPGI